MKTSREPSLPEPLRALRDAWLGAIAPARRRALLAGVSLSVTFAMLVARMGTTRARLGAVAILLLMGVIAAVVRLRDRRIFGDPARTIEHVAGSVEPDLAGRAIRALSLLRTEAARGASAQLAELHVRRTLAALPREGVTRGASRVAAVLGVATFFLVATNVAACATSPWGVIEGFDVLVSRNGVAPLGMAWLAEPQIRARPPDYLHQEERRVVPYDEVALPRGTLLTVRGTPVHAGRRLLLTDGSAEVPFVDDGAGGVVARWPLAETVKLRVVARFGDVVIPEPQETPVESIPDAVPVVQLEGAPRRIVLAGEEDASEIPIHYEATDDHGLREVHLVLRAAAREERRVLARLDGETKSDRGGYTLRASDAFIKKSHAPIEIRVEAKDNDPITGPKWGASEAITVVPPDVGEPEARRLAGLVRLRDALVDALAWRLGRAVPTDMKERRAFLDREAKLDEEDSELLETTLSTSYAGVRVPSRLAAMLRGRMRKVKEAVANQARNPSTATHAALVKATERMTLVVDAVVQGQGLKDTRDVARELADVADDLAVGASLSQKPAEKKRGEERMDAAVLVLGGGGRAMRRLGALGRDLGEIVEMDLVRIARARKGDDLPHTVLAAQDLATRLRQPDGSFSTRGGRPSHAGGESGGSRGAPNAEDGEGSDVDQAFNEAAQELERLAAEHAGHVGKVEQSLAGGTSDEDLKQLSEEAKKHAQKVRDAARPLPSVGGGSDSWTSKGAAAREHAEQMARSLEQGQASDAVQSGRNAMSALEEAKRAAARDRWGRFGDSASERTIEESRRSIEAELKWAEDKLEEMRKRAAQRANPELREHGDTEGKLADKARDIAKKGREQDAPPAALEALRAAEQAAREAANSLKQGDAEKGLQHQRDAQQKLEMAREALGDQDGERGGEGEDGPRDNSGRADIPKADAHKGPEEFRKRVIKGLGQPSGGRLKDAVKRYAEGLLR
ncbi:MAG: DUF4175 family protein [Deltaproteobacteria bacterium]|nr:DUF4175 family protein [Deltaproteobacteria bacterium]